MNLFYKLFPSLQPDTQEERAKKHANDICYRLTTEMSEEQQSIVVQELVQKIIHHKKDEINRIEIELKRLKDSLDVLLNY